MRWIAVALSVVSICLAHEPEAVEILARETFMNGLPIRAIRQYDPHKTIPKLLTMLDDPRQEGAWGNGVLILGLIGGREDAATLIKFICVGKGEISETAASAKFNALIALGYLVYSTDDERTLNYLATGTDPAVWETRQIAWTSKRLQTASVRNHELTRFAVLALGLTGNRVAKHFLYSKLKRDEQGAETSILREALRNNRLVAHNGLDGYYSGH